MQRGPKKSSIEDKKVRGTYRPFRDNPTILLPSANTHPMMPTYLAPAAQAVWLEEIMRVMDAGTSELDSSLFARYCSLEAIVRENFANDIEPKATYLVELRKLSELLGIGGAPSRRQRGVAAEPDNQNEFAALFGG